MNKSTIQATMSKSTLRVGHGSAEKLSAAGSKGAKVSPWRHGFKRQSEPRITVGHGTSDALDNEPDTMVEIECMVDRLVSQL